MRQHNAENERVKRDYLIYLKAAKGLSEASLDTVAKAIHRFEVSTKFRPFRKFHIEQAVAFRRQLSEMESIETGKPLSKATVLQTLNALRAFFLWLAGQPGYRSQISYSDADYFRLSEKDTRIAKAARERPVPTLEQIRGVLAVMPHVTEIERRNRALIAFTLLTGVRDGALASLKLKHVDLAAAKVVQDAREVNTKFSKTFTTWFFPGPADKPPTPRPWSTADVEGLRRFLEGEVLPWFETRKKELTNRPLIREQAFGEALDPDRLERLGRYEVHLDRKLERMLAMLLRLKELRQGTVPG